MPTTRRFLRCSLRVPLHPLLSWDPLLQPAVKNLVKFASGRAGHLSATGTRRDTRRNATSRGRYALGSCRSLTCLRACQLLPALAQALTACVPQSLLLLRIDRRSLGLSGLTGQVFRKVTKKGFEFCLMVAGETGLGKSTLINSLFLTESEIDDAAARTSAHSRIEQTVQVTASSKNITEGSVHLKLTIVDTPGFADAVNNQDCWRPIVDYINEAYEDYLQDESQVDRTKIVDRRVHCLLYFVNPTGRGCVPASVLAPFLSGPPWPPSIDRAGPPSRWHLAPSSCLRIMHPDLSRSISRP